MIAEKAKKELRFAAIRRVSTEQQGKAGESLRTQTTEIEEAVKDALYTAFDRGKGDITTDDVAESLASLTPISRSEEASQNPLSPVNRSAPHSRGQREQDDIRFQSFSPLFFNSPDSASLRYPGLKSELL